MNFADAEKIAASVLYEGYILYPYRASSTKNAQRWNFGTLYPRDYAESLRPAEPFRLHAEFLVSTSGVASLDLRVRFLQLVRKQAGTAQEWDEGVEQTANFVGLNVAELVGKEVHQDAVLERSNTVANSDTEQPRNVKKLSGSLDIGAQEVQNGLYRLKLEFSNVTPMANPSTCSRKDAMLEAFVSAHVLLGVTGGDFVSLLEPPAELEPMVAACRNDGVFPVLVGEEGQRSMLLCSPIILYDYPKIAPESAGDFFDGTEMDEMLALRVLTLTDEEKQEMRTGDDRARRILERTENMPEEFLSRVHGAIRSMRGVVGTESAPAATAELAPWSADWDPTAERAPVESVRVFGVELRTGSRVRLWPQKQADIMDMALKGKVALIEAIEQDYEDNVQLAVVLDDDPGREFGMMRQPGHRFFFSPDEVEPLEHA